MIVIGGFFQTSQQRGSIRYRTVLVRGCTPNFDNTLRGCAYARYEFIFNLRREIREKSRIGQETLQHAFSDIFGTNAGLKIRLPPRLPGAAVTAGSAPAAEAACARLSAVPTLSRRAKIRADIHGRKHGSFRRACIPLAFEVFELQPSQSGNLTHQSQSQDRRLLHRKDQRFSFRREFYAFFSIGERLSFNEKAF